MIGAEECKARYPFGIYRKHLLRFRGVPNGRLNKEGKRGMIAHCSGIFWRDLYLLSPTECV